MLQRQEVNINFAQGLDTKTDPFQVQAGKFLSLVNSVFTTGGRLTKRPGFGMLTSLPNNQQTTLTTLNNNLIATGSNMYALASEAGEWLNKGIVQPVNLSVQSVVRTSTSQTSSDSAVTASGLACVTYLDSGSAYYHVVDSNTGQQVVNRTLLAATAASPRAFLLGNYFILTYTATISASSHLQYVIIPINNPTNPFAPIDISSSLPSINVGYDGYVADGSLFIAWADAGSTLKVSYIPGATPSTITTPFTITGSTTASLVSVTADFTPLSPYTLLVYVLYYDSSAGGTLASFTSTLAPVLAPSNVFSSTSTITEITGVASGGLYTFFYETNNSYASPYPVSSVQTDFISSNTVTQAGSVGSPKVILRSVGLASKAFIGASGTIYMLAAYGESNQPTYFLIDSKGNVYMRLAYSNGGGYETSQVLPTVNVVGSSYIVAYLFKDFLASVNKGTNLPTGTPTNGIYTQTGVNLAKFSINSSGQTSSEIASALHLTGGQLWMYDGTAPVEHGFQVWPENVQAVWSATGGSIVAKPVPSGSNTNAYFYQFIYQWTDAAGNIHQSAPSIPTAVTTTGNGTSGSITLYVPTLRLTYKTNVRIVGFRWSQAQQVYYQFTSITSPVANDPTVDYVTIVDTQSDAQILGNPLIYTSGGVVEDIAAPASIASTMYNTRLFLVDAEDQNLLWYSKQVIENVPVEFSDLFTLFVAPTIGAQGSTGPMTALAAMDDKLVIFKKDAIYYMTGIGPDNTGANNDFSQPVFITAAVGTSNPRSVVLTPAGLMFQSDKGIWLLGRDLSTGYIGAPVEVSNSNTVKSAQVIPGTTQVRFTLDNSTTLMYDYFYQQWGTHTNISSISSTLYNGVHTYLNKYGQVLRENPTTYLDGSTPVLMSLTTSWINVAGLQGFERFWEMLILGQYYTPFNLYASMAYDYNSGPVQMTKVVPQNAGELWGSEAQWGTGGPWGGPGAVFEARVFPQRQKCESFQLTLQEQYDPSFGISAGAGLSLSGLNLSVGVKRGRRTSPASRNFG